MARKRLAGGRFHGALSDAQKAEWLSERLQYFCSNHAPDHIAPPSQSLKSGIT
jgi:hypothetical protein